MVSGRHRAWSRQTYPGTMTNTFLVAVLVCSLVQGTLALIKGTPVSPRTKYPWFAYVTTRGGVTCGGTILDSAHVLTSNKCKGLPQRMAVAVGLYRVNKETSNTQLLTVRRVFTHFAYNATTGANDLCILRVSRITFTDAVQPATISDNVFDKNPGMDCWLTGFGLINQKPDEYPERFRELGTMPLSRQRCIKMADAKMGLGDRIDKSTLCTRNPYAGPCTGDIGGPMGCYNAEDGIFYVLGLLSWGNVDMGRRCDLGFNVYTRLSQYAFWIDSIIN